MTKKTSKKNVAPNRDVRTDLGNPEKFRRLFIGGLSENTTEESLRRYFASWGRIEYCSLMKKPESGFGFIVYQTAKQSDEAQAHRPHFIDNKEVYTRRAMPINSSDETRTFKEIIVGKLLENTTMDEIYNIFYKYGTIEDINVIRDIDTDQGTPYCSIIFDDYDAVDKCILTQYFTIRSKTVEAKRASPVDYSVFRRLFVDGLNFNTTKESLCAYFEHWGEVVDCELIDNPNTEFYRSGFITYRCTEYLEDAQADRPHAVDGQEVCTRRANPDVSSMETISRQIFVNGLDENTSETDIHNVFSRYGIVEYISMITDGEAGRSKTYCFVTFDDYDSADKCILIQNFQFGSTTLKVKRVLPNDFTEDADCGSNEDLDSCGNCCNHHGNVAGIEGMNATALPVKEPMDENIRVIIDPERNSITLEVTGDGAFEELVRIRVALLLSLMDKIVDEGFLETDDVPHTSDINSRRFSVLVQTSGHDPLSVS